MEALRAGLGDALPAEQNTDYQLARWLDNYDQKVEPCLKNYKEYLKIRKALHLDTKDKVAAVIKKDKDVGIGKFITRSSLSPDWVNTKDNGIVFVEKIIEDPSKFVKTANTGTYLRGYFAYCEFFQYMVLEREQKTGQKSHGICIYDLSNIALKDFMPSGSLLPLLMARTKVYQEYFAELVTKIIIVNSPFWVPMAFVPATFFIEQRLRGRFHVLTKYPAGYKDLISLDAVPKGYKGEREPLPGENDKCVLPAHKIEPKDYKVSGLYWKKHNLLPEYKTYSIHEDIEITVNPEGKKKLVYEFHTSGEIQLWFEQGDEDLTPRFKIVTPVLNEEEEVDLFNANPVTLHIRKQSSLLGKMVNGSITSTIKIAFAFV